MHLLGITWLAFSSILFAAAAPVEVGISVVDRTNAFQRRQTGAPGERVQFYDQRGAVLTQMNVADTERVRTAFRQAIALASAATRIPNDSPLYASFFRDNTQYSQVMNIFQRVVTLLTTDDDDEDAETLVFVRSNRPAGTPATATAETQQNRILLFDSFFALEFFRPFVGSNIGLNILMGSDAGVILHELVHFLSANRMRTVVGNLVITGGQMGVQVANSPFNRFQFSTAIVDVDPANFALATVETDVLLSGILRSGGNGPRAYGLSRTLGLSQLTLGAFAAALNADSYVGLAVAAFINWSYENFQFDINPPVFTNRQQISAWRNMDQPDEDPSVNDPDDGAARATLNLNGDDIPDRWNDDNNTPGPSGGNTGSTGEYVGNIFGKYSGDL
ncbi:hypothetical protein LTR56_016989 [Elasticomyces elasticus]|nr:hypothetical protein LTR56_016989 [Elasticomyces elasticus]KAK3636127.1 hypothetical protein LTR22_018885 [Elasticomyces elasticus]KAK4912104.1 hypothetical protein LTR49_019390 [Elasticomyces elasticus]KAK5753650.1 hypothetical protein LTS12_016287 [Elasticomyces elasticus]